MLLNTYAHSLPTELGGYADALASPDGTVRHQARVAAGDGSGGSSKTPSRSRRSVVGLPGLEPGTDGLKVRAGSPPASPSLRPSLQFRSLARGAVPLRQTPSRSVRTLFAPSRASSSATAGSSHLTHGGWLEAASAVVFILPFIPSPSCRSERMVTPQAARKS